MLNRPSSINEDAIDRLPQIECKVLLDQFPTVTETRKAVQQLPSGKAQGADAVPAMVCKAGGYPWQYTSGKASPSYALLEAEIKMKRLESPPSGHFMIVARVPVAPLTIRRHIVSETKPML